MVRRNAIRCFVATIALIGTRGALADPIAFTGFVEQDFPTSDQNVHVTPVDPNPLATIYQMPQMTAAGLINGWAIKDIRTSYDAPTDTLSVGVNTYSIAGTAVGNGGPPFETLLNSMGGVDEAHIGGQKSISVAFAPDGPFGPSTHGNASVVSGVPADKAFAAAGTVDGFTVAKYSGGAATDIENHYGPTLTNNLGNLAFDPSAAHPNFEYTIKNFSTIPGIDPTKGFWMMAYAGSPNDYPIGEENFAWTRIPSFSPEIPEPATWLAWSILAGGAACRLRRRGTK